VDGTGSIAAGTGAAVAASVTSATGAATVAAGVLAATLVGSVGGERAVVARGVETLTVGRPTAAGRPLANSEDVKKPPSATQTNPSL